MTMEDYRNGAGSDVTSSADTVLPWLFFGFIERCPPRELRRPDCSDDAVHRALAWRRLCTPHRDGSRLLVQPEFSSPIQDASGRRDNSERIRSSIVSNAVR